ncbi:Mur ligase domain-containing protein, partial [Francisella tularensis]
MLFLGVGGFGVSALAIAAKRLGAHVDGYDSVANNVTAKLEALGIVLFI